MKKLFFFFLLITALSAGSQIAPLWSNATITIPSGGGTLNVKAVNLPGLIYISSSGSISLSGNYTVALDSTPPVGTLWTVHYITTGVTFGIYTITIFNVSIGEATDGYLNFWVEKAIGGGKQLNYTRQPSFILNDGSFINAGSLQFSQLQNLTAGNILVGNVSNVPTSVALTGDIGITNAGVSSIVAGTIVNADVNASAAIARTKLAAGTASQVIVNDVSGVLTSEATLNPLRGGLGINASSSTGFAKWSSGSVTIGTLTDAITTHVSFETDAKGLNIIPFGFAVTITEIEVWVEKKIEATDSATILFQNDAGVAMTGSALTSGKLVLAAAATTGTGYYTSIATNNTFTAGQRMRITSAKGTAGGTANITVTYTRLN